MGLRKGTLSFSRYRLIGDLPDHFPEFFNERIRRYAFQTVWRTADEKAAGWTGLENPLDTDFPYASYAQGRYLLFSLRIDRKSVAPSLLRLRIMEAERKQARRKRPEETLPGTARGDPGVDAPRTAREDPAGPLLF